MRPERVEVSDFEHRGRDASVFLFFTHTKMNNRRRVAFDYELACEIGVNAAIVFEKIAYYLSEKAKSEKHFIKGRYWFYVTHQELADKIGVLSVKQIRNAIATLVANDYITVDNFSFGRVNRTPWYTVSEEKMSKYYPDFGYTLPPNSSAQKEKCSALSDECSAHLGISINSMNTHEPSHEPSKEKEIISPDKEKESPKVLAAEPPRKRENNEERIRQIAARTRELQGYEYDTLPF